MFVHTAASVAPAVVSAVPTTLSLAIASTFRPTVAEVTAVIEADVNDLTKYAKRKLDNVKHDPRSAGDIVNSATQNVLEAATAGTMTVTVPPGITKEEAIKRYTQKAIKNAVNTPESLMASITHAIGTDKVIQRFDCAQNAGGTRRQPATTSLDVDLFHDTGGTGGPKRGTTEQIRLPDDPITTAAEHKRVAELTILLDQFIVEDTPETVEVFNRNVDELHRIYGERGILPRFLDGATIREIAEKNGVSERTVRRYHHGYRQELEKRKAKARPPKRVRQLRPFHDIVSRWSHTLERGYYYSEIGREECPRRMYDSESSRVWAAAREDYLANGLLKPVTATLPPPADGSKPSRLFDLRWAA